MFDVGRTLVRDFRLAVGDRSETVIVRAEAPLIDRATATVGHVVTAQTVQQIPLNGRHFTDLGLLVPGVGRAVADRVLHHADSRGRARSPSTPPAIARRRSGSWSTACRPTT